MGETPRSAPPSFRFDDIARDTGIALRLIEAGLPSGVSAREVRVRLREHIRMLLDPAELYAQSLPDNRARDIAIYTVEHARAVADNPGTDPVASLRLLSKSAEVLARYSVNSHLTETRTHSNGGSS